LTLDPCPCPYTRKREGLPKKEGGRDLRKDRKKIEKTGKKLI